MERISILKTLTVALFLMGISACQEQSSPEGAITTAPVSVSDQDSQAAKEGGVYSFGLPACDAFLKKYEDCVKAIAEGEEREKHRILFEKTVEELAKAQEGTLSYGLTEACERRMHEAKSLLSDKSCRW